MEQHLLHNNSGSNDNKNCSKCGNSGSPRSRNHGIGKCCAVPVADVTLAATAAAGTLHPREKETENFRWPWVPFTDLGRPRVHRLCSRSPRNVDVALSCANQALQAAKPRHMDDDFGGAEDPSEFCSVVTRDEVLLVNMCLPCRRKSTSSWQS